MGRAGELIALRALSRILAILPVGSGQHAVARRVTPRYRECKHCTFVQSFSDGARFELDLADRAQAHAFLVRRYAPELVKAITALLPTGGTFLDIGANIGLVSFSVGRRRPDSSIHAFEPDPNNVERWRRNHELNPQVRARLQPCAVGAEIGELPLVTGRESGWSYVDEAAAEGIRVPVTTVDAYVREAGIPTVDVIKIDVEGFEVAVLEGARRLFAEKRVGAVVCEINEVTLRRAGQSKASILSFFAELEYEPKPVPRVGLHRLVQREAMASADLLFVPKRASRDEQRRTVARGDARPS